MAKTRRASHRGGNERPRWIPGALAADDVDQSVNEPVAATAAAHDEAAVAESDATANGWSMPVRVDEIAVAAMALSDGLRAATDHLPDSAEARRFRRRLDDVARACREMAGELEVTAGELVRVVANSERTCELTWGICPEHGVTLVVYGEVSRCRIIGCHRPAGTPERCTQEVEYRVIDAAGPSLQTCTGHAIASRTLLPGAVITQTTDTLELL
ncbi:hypothetical protein OG394_02240 [Kribbella sp. NBC_01245]|uniref:hypothetical protein n=1 Tax=Kribbella sp. NBC_01245 TaxID=2903578 RepID=UPI002E2CCCEE|nr:hypothetical protein [Kribbella sp. NBC_01245]